MVWEDDLIAPVQTGPGWRTYRRRLKLACTFDD